MFSKNHQQEQHHQTMTAYACPTSPWTEPYQCAPSQQAEPRAFNSDDQSPCETGFAKHDALSDFYDQRCE